MHLCEDDSDHVPHGGVRRQQEFRLHVLEHAREAGRLTSRERKIVLDNPRSKDLEEATLRRFDFRVELALFEVLLHQLRARQREATTGGRSGRFIGRIYVVTGLSSSSSRLCLFLMLLGDMQREIPEHGAFLLVVPVLAIDASFEAALAARPLS